MKPLRIGIIGLGTVGSSVVKLLQSNAKDIERRLGQAIVVTHACARDISKPRTCDLSQIKLTADPKEMTEHPDIDLVVEVMGGTDTARDLVKNALNHNKPVVTANKALLAEHGAELFSLAKKQQQALLFEAAVAGGIPIVKTVREGLSGNPVNWFAGIINGTGNYILTEMLNHQREFEQALQQAQELGYAEADPSFDIGGIDAAHKLTLLATLAFGIPVRFEQVYIEGIDKVTQYDVMMAERLGYVIKHLALARPHSDGQGYFLNVYPAMLPKQHLLAQVSGVMNAIYAMTELSGPMMFYGAGAGGDATASAIIADIIDFMRFRQQNEANLSDLGFLQLSERAVIQPVEQLTGCYYLRVHVADQMGTMAEITQILAQHKISIDSIHQRHEEAEGGVVPVTIVTNPTLEKTLNLAIDEINRLEVLSQPVQRIRMESLQE